MKLCLVMIGRFEARDNCYYGDQKNINAIERYFKFFDEILVVAREDTNENSIYKKKKIDCKNGRLTFKLYKEHKLNLDLFKNHLYFSRVLDQSIEESDFVICWSEPKSQYIVNKAHQKEKKILIYVGGCNYTTLLNHVSYKKRILAPFILLSNKIAIKKADFVHYVTEIELQKKYPSKKPQLAATYAEISLSRVNESRAIRNNKIQIGLIGYLNAVKGIDTAIKSLANMDEKFILNILGGGDPQTYKALAIRLGVENRVIFHGTLPPGDAVKEWLKGIDIYIQPSRTEGLPRATIEAMSVGCPTVTSNVIGLKELTSEAYQHKPGDYKTLAKLIENLKLNVDEYRMQSERNFHHVQKYNRNKLDIKISDFFSDYIVRYENAD